MGFFRKNQIRLLCVLSGLGAGISCLEISNAALPSRTTPVTAGQDKTGKTLLREMKDGKISSPEFEQELSELNRLEARYVESPEQMEKLRNRTRPRAERASALLSTSKNKKAVKK